MNYVLYNLGPSLPIRLSDSAMVSNGNSIVIVGGMEYPHYPGSDFDFESDHIFELKSSPNMKWIDSSKNLRYKRSSHLAFSIPDDFKIDFEIHDEENVEDEEEDLEYDFGDEPIGLAEAA